MRILITVLAIIIFGCQSETENGNFLPDVPVYIPQEITRFTSAGDSLFVSLGQSTVLEDGNLLIADKMHDLLFKVTTGGELLDVPVTTGRGPGEVLSVSFISRSALGNTLLYDRTNGKMVLLDSLGNYSGEFVLPVWKDAFLRAAYEIDNRQYIFGFHSYSYIHDAEKEQEAHLVLYDKDQEKYKETRGIFFQQTSVLKKVANGTIWAVPYAPEDLLAYNRNTSALYVFNSGGDEIIQLDTSLDTLEVIPLNLQPQPLSAAEKDSMRNEFSPDHWDAIQHLLPEYKAVADRMMIDHENNFWLKLNYASGYQQWLVVSDQGEFLAIIQLPKEAVLTHISEHHLGVLLDEITFALFQPLEL